MVKMKQSSTLKMRAPFIGAALLLCVVWVLWLTDFHPHLSNVRTTYLPINILVQSLIVAASSLHHLTAATNGGQIGGNLDRMPPM